MLGDMDYQMMFFILNMPSMPMDRNLQSYDTKGWDKSDVPMSCNVPSILANCMELRLATKICNWEIVHFGW
jgi:hypothetical protein